MNQPTPPIEAVAAELGLEMRRGRRLNPCPACQASDKRGVIVYGGPRWTCTRCGEKGDTVNLVSFVVAGQRRAYREAFAWLKERGQVEPLPSHEVQPEKPRLPKEEVAALLRACTPVSETRDARVLHWLAHRPVPLDPKLVPAAVLPPPRHPVYGQLARYEWDDRQVPWWPRKWSTLYPLVVPAWTGHGHLGGIHARAVDPDAPRKSTWPLAVDCRALLFADPVLARPMLRGNPEGITAVLIAEGLPDFLYACQEARQIPGLAVLGIESGSAPALKLIRWPRDVRIYTSVHPDEAGDRYAEAIAQQLAPRPVYRLPLDRVRPAA